VREREYLAEREREREREEREKKVPERKEIQYKWEKTIN
jgi:hypothetical protein